MPNRIISHIFILILLVSLLIPLGAASAAANSQAGNPAVRVSNSSTFPEVIPLPNGFQPEGIALGKRSTFYTGSLADGAIYRGDLLSGAGDILVPGQAGRVAVGMSFDARSGNLFVAGGPTGQAFVYDGSSGEELASYTLGDGFINDVIVTRQAAYFTNSFQAAFYRLPLGPAGALPDQSAVQTIDLVGDWVQDAGFNANGIEASTDGKALVIVNSSRGELYRVDPQTGEAALIDLGGGDVLAGDGLVFRGPNLYVVQNQFNQVAEVRMDKDLASGEIRRILTNPNFRVPTTAAKFGGALYIVNARFGVPDPSTADYDIVRTALFP